MSGELWWPRLDGTEDDPVRAACAQAVGAGSACWTWDGDERVFDSETAQRVAEGLARWVERFIIRDQDVITIPVRLWRDLEAAGGPPPLGDDERRDLRRSVAALEPDEFGQVSKGLVIAMIDGDVR